MDRDPILRERIERLQERLMEDRQELARLRAQLSAEDVLDFTLQSLAGPVKLHEAFGSRSDLLVVHNMGAACAWCTLWADGFNGMLAHLENRAAFVLVSPDPPQIQHAFATSRGWRFRMLSDADGQFTREMGFVRMEGTDEHLWPGVSAFARGAGNKIQRTGSAPFGPGDLFCPAWHLFGLLRDGAERWNPQNEYEAQSVIARAAGQALA